MKLTKIGGALSDRCKWTRTSLTLPKNLSRAEWEQIGEGLSQVEGAVMWWMGDWWAFGEDHEYGDRKEYSDSSEYSFQTWRDAAWVSRKFSETSRRRDVLPWSFHREVANLPEKDQDQLLDKAEEKKLTIRELRQLVRQRKAYNEARAEQEFPKKTYKIIYADPPWQYGNSQPLYHSDPADHYPLLSADEVAQLPIYALAQKNAVLFLWVTSPMLAESFDVVEAWGFEYKTAFIWDKVRHNMGHYNSVRHELLLVCVRGSCTPQNIKLYDSVQTIERSKKHSEKPDKFRNIIDTLYPHGRRIELFSRRQSDGWDTWGNE